MARRVRTNVFVLAGYALISFVYFGWPLVGHPGRYILGSGRDPQIFIWSFAWWPHAVETWQNPFFTHVVYAPVGINLAWTTTVPGLAFAFWPVTALFGPTVAYNLAALLMPALSAWTAYLLCRHVTKALWAALIGGYLFGFSSYELGQELGHLHLTAVFLLPLIALALIRFVRGEIEAKGLGLRLGLLLGLQLWISMEILFTATLALLLGLALTFALVRDTRPRLRHSLRPLAAAYGLALLIGGPLVVYAVIGFRTGTINTAPATTDGDLLNFIVPTHLTALGGSLYTGISDRFDGSDAERGAYLGLPILAIIEWYAVRTWRSATARLALALFAVAVLITLGTSVTVEGKTWFRLPWDVVARAPIFDNMLPARISLFSSLAAAVIVALWTASRRRWLALLVPLVAVAALVPAFWHDDYRLVPERWAFFTDGADKCIPQNDIVAIFPYGEFGDSMLWQAESDFQFRMAEGYLSPMPPPKFMKDPTVRELTDSLEIPTISQILAFVRDEKVDRIVSVDIYVHPNGTQMHRFGEVESNGGVLIAPACGYPSMQKGIHPTPPHPPGERG